MRVVMGFAARARAGLVVAARGTALAALAPSLNIVLLVASVVSLAVVPLGLGVFLFPKATAAVRRLARRQRRWAEGWSGVAVAAPYRPSPESGGRGAGGPLRRCAWLVTDPATWRDLAWLAAEIPVGLVLGILSAAFLVYGLEGVLVAPWIAHVAGGYGWGPFWPLDGATALLAVPLGLGLVAVSPKAGPAVLRAHAVVARSLLAPTGSAALSTRVRQLTETRTAAVDLSAAELRRIERDLHDGAQARLAALGMTLGLAESLFPTDPETGLRLVAEARETGNQALAELRDLVRGIHPPVLAERGLEGAVKALALTLPLPVTVEASLPGRTAAPLESAAYFAVAEVLANVAKHSGAATAGVELRHADDRLILTVWDDGAGGADPALGTGLRGVARRLSAFDGTLSLTSPPGGPTTVLMEVPCRTPPGPSSSPRTWPSSGTA